MTELEHAQKVFWMLPLQFDRTLSQDAGGFIKKVHCPSIHPSSSRAPFLCVCMCVCGMCAGACVDGSGVAHMWALPTEGAKQHKEVG